MSDEERRWLEVIASALNYTALSSRVIYNYPEAAILAFIELLLIRKSLGQMFSGNRGYIAGQMVVSADHFFEKPCSGDNDRLRRRLTALVLIAASIIHGEQRSLDEIERQIQEVRKDL